MSCCITSTVSVSSDPFVPKGYVVVGAFILFVLLVIYWYLYADKLVVKKLSRQVNTAARS